MHVLCRRSISVVATWRGLGFLGVQSTEEAAATSKCQELKPCKNTEAAAETTEAAPFRLWLCCFEASLI